MSTPDVVSFTEMTGSPERPRYREPKYTVGKAMTYLLSFVVALLTLKTAVASKSNVPRAPFAHATEVTAETAPPPVETPRRVSAEALFAEYSANQTLAEAKYKDHSLEVAGHIQSVYQDPWGEVVVVLQTTDPFHGVRATLASRGTRDLKRGEDVSLVCHGGERMVGSPTLAACTIG